MCTRSTKRQRESKSSLPQPHNVEHLRRRLSNHGGDENGRRLDSSRLDISDDGHRAIDGNCSGHILTALPNHIMSAILFGYLDQSPKQLTRIRSVCRLFRDISRDSCAALDLRPDSTTRKADITRAFDVFICQFINLQAVDFSCCDNFADCHMEMLLPVRSKLRVLKLRGTMITDAGVMSFFQYDTVPKKKSDTEPRPSLPLEVLDLSETKPLSTNNITDTALLAVAYSCLELKHLSLSMCSGITDVFLESVPHFLTKLIILDVSMTAITSRGCCHLAKMSALRAVDISACPGLNWHTIKALVEGKVDEADINEENDQHLMHRPGLSRENGSVSLLTSISARFANEIDGVFLESLATQAPYLQCLDIRHHREKDLQTGSLSPLKTSLRKLRRNGVEVAFSSVCV